MNKAIGKVIAVKNITGGVGKTFITTQLASGLSMVGKKVLILTTDPSNNIFNMIFNENSDFQKGLKAEVLKGNGEYFRVRENLYFLPLEDAGFSHIFLKKLPNFLEMCKVKFDYIFIDGSSILETDKIFLRYIDSIVIPFFSNEIGLKGTLDLIEIIDPSKVKAIITNRYEATKNQLFYYNSLRINLKKAKFLVTTPIESLSFIETIIENKKTIWEFTNKKAIKIQNLFLKVIISL